MKSGSLNLLEPSEPHRTCYGNPLLYVKERKAGNEGRESRWSEGKGIFVTLQAMDIYKGKPRLWEMNSKFLAPVTVPSLYSLCVPVGLQKFIGSFE